MKKTVRSLLLILLLSVFTLTSCGEGDSAGDGGNSQGSSDQNGSADGGNTDNTDSGNVDNTNGGNSNDNSDGSENADGNECSHEYGEWQTVTAATCKEDGELIRTCGKCGESERATDPKTDNHTPVTDPALAPTCKSTGLTEGSHCSVCEKVLVAQTEIPKSTEHNYSSVEVEATRESQGYFIYTCGVCGDSYNGGYYDYAGTKSLVYSELGDGTCLVSGISDANETVLDIPEKSPSGSTVIGIANYAFQMNQKITSLNAPKTMKSIGERAFFNCDSLKSAYIPGVDTIKNNAFDSCGALASVVYSDSLTAVGDEAFSDCNLSRECRALSSSKNIDTIISFGYHAFSNTKLTNPTFSSKLNSTSLANDPFYRCKSLGKVDLSAASITSLGGGFDATSFTEFIFPKGLSEIARGAFSGCSFKTMTIPNQINKIESNAFYGASFTKVILGKNVYSIGDSAFEGTTGDIDISNATKLDTVGYRAFAQSSIKTLILPSSVVKIGEEAFADCTSLSTLGIPFVSTSSKSSNLSTNCFGRIFSSSATTSNQKNYVPSSLKTVIITGNGAELEDGDFSGLKLTTLVLPKNFTAAYRSLDFTLTNVFYCGSVTEFPGISEATDGRSVKVLYYSETQPGVTGTQWRYVNGIPTAW